MNTMHIIVSCSITSYDNYSSAQLTYIDLIIHTIPQQTLLYTI